MSKIVQIGSGMIGTTMAYDLSQEHDIIVGDFDDSSFAKLERLNPNIVTKKTVSYTHLTLPTILRV